MDGADRRSGFRSAANGLSRIRSHLLVIPGEPVLGVFEELGGMLLKSGQVLEGVDAVERTCVNETHEQIADVSPMFGLKKQRIFSMKDRPLKHLFTDIIV